MRVILAYFLVIAIWTTTPLAIQWSGEADWFFGVASRLGLSAMLILPLVIFFTDRRFSFSWSNVKVYAAAAIGLLGGMTPIYWSAQTMPSGWIALIWGMTPIVTGFLVFLLLANQAITPNKWLGMFVSLVGLGIVFLPNLDPEVAKLQIIGLSLALVGVFFHSLSTVLVKKTNHDLPPIHVVTGALWITSIVFVIFKPSLLFDWPPMSEKNLWSIAYLVTIGSVVGFVLYYYVLKHMDAIRLGMIPMITPVFALILGYSINAEELNLTIWLGTGLVVVGLILFELNTLQRHRKQKQWLAQTPPE
ncbi:MAG: DMT family transporter [Thiomicrospira sp.]|jgi:drug/metabolite transporter (DMT)-like permease|nr:DMT family transporter [Thiomicrospira sp.]